MDNVHLIKHYTQLLANFKHSQYTITQTILREIKHINVGCLLVRFYISHTYISVHKNQYDIKHIRFTAFTEVGLILK